MALGGNFNNNNAAKKSFDYCPSVISDNAFFNGTSDVATSKMAFSFWKGFLKISIIPLVLDTVNNRMVETNNENEKTKIFLKSHSAKIFLNEINEFIKDPTKYANRGVNSGKSDIFISNGKDANTTNTPMIIIRELNEDHTAITKSAAYVFNQNKYFSMRNFVSDNMNFEKEEKSYNNIELELFKTMLEEYINSSAGAYAAQNIAKLYTENEHNHINHVLFGVAKKLGVTFADKATTNTSSFGNSNIHQKQYSESTLDSIIED